MKKLGLGLTVLAVLAAIFWWAIGADWRRFLLNPPIDSNVLFWSIAERDAGFRMMDRVPFLVDSRIIAAGEAVRLLPQGAPLNIDFDVDEYLDESRASAMIILQDGKVRYEAYRLGFTDTGRWTSFSVAKSLTSTLVGAAIKDGHIASLNDPVSEYIAGLKGSAYDDVTIEQLLTMSSGVAWNEDYEDPNSDVALFNTHLAEDGESNLVSYMRTLERAHPPGTVWNYSTGETNMIGILVREAIGRDLNDYLSEKIWAPYGMQQDASWLLNDDGTEISGCCIQAATRDFARFGQFILDGAKIDGASIVPEGWIPAATTTQMPIGRPGAGYGYQWWTQDSGAFGARGIFGQAIYIDPQLNLVIATNSSWRSALGERDGEAALRDEFYAAITAAIRQEKTDNAN